MNLAAFNAAGYAPIPLRGGRPAIGGALSNRPSWRYASGSDDRFVGCDVGLLCASRPLSGASGAATLGAVSSTWIAGVRWESSDRRLSTDIAALVQIVAGPGPTRTAGAETLRVFKVDQPFVTRPLSPMYFPKERWRDLSYRPHRVSVLSVASWVAVSGGTWANGSLPEVRRDQLPTLTKQQADEIVSGIEQLLATKGALPWT